MAEYDEFQEEEKLSWKEYVIKYSYLLIGGAIWLFFRGRIGTRIFDNAALLGGGIMLTGSLALLVYSSWKNATSKIVFNWGHSTTDGEIIKLGNYGIVQPAIKAYQWYFKLHGAYIFPVDGYGKSGPNIVIHAKMDTASIDELPLEIKSFIMDKSIKPPYNIGFADVEQYEKMIENPDGELKPKISVEYLIHENKELRKENSFLRAIKDGKLKDIERFVEFGKRVSKGKGLADTLKDAFMSKEGEP